MLKIKKSIIAVSALTTILSISMLNASANSPSTHGDLHIDYHYVPILKDSARGNGTGNSQRGMIPAGLPHRICPTHNCRARRK